MSKAKYTLPMYETHIRHRQRIISTLAKHKQLGFLQLQGRTRMAAKNLTARLNQMERAGEVRCVTDTDGLIKYEALVERTAGYKTPAEIAEAVSRGNESDAERLSKLVNNPLVARYGFIKEGV